ncbi:MAG TPA: DUF2934 domain-containing protein [Terriglobales bacterium]|nr:DUF2934 domain-containing protein [Terriglobales bacterium]
MAREKKTTGDTAKKRIRKTPVAVAETMRAVSENGEVQILQVPSNGGRDRDGSDEQVRRRAYEIWEQRGRQHGKDADDWYRAESELRGKSA